MSNNFYAAIGLIGGADGQLDYFDGDALADNDGAIVITDTERYSYVLDASSGLPESSPNVIKPDNNAGNKRWILVTASWAGAVFSGPVTIHGNDIVTTPMHGGKKERYAGNNGMGQSFPAFVKYEQSAVIIGTRTSDTVFTRTSGTWVVDALVGQYVFSYVDGVPGTGVWLKILSNTTTAITCVVGSILQASADRITTCIWNPIQDEFAHGQGNGAFQDGVFDGESLWLIPYNSSDLVKVNVSDGSMTSYAHGKGAAAFNGGIFDGESLWLVPYDSPDLVKVDVSDGSMTSYTHGQGGAAFIGGTFDGESLWMTPVASSNFVKVNVSDGSMTSYAHGKGGAAFIGAVFDGESLWMIPYHSNDFVKVDVSDGSMTSYAHGKGNGAFSGGVFDGESLWLVPRDSNDLVRVNVSDGSMTSYAHGRSNNAFIGGAFDGESLWLIPDTSSDLVKVDISDGSMISYAHGKGANAFQGAVFDGESVWMIPRNSSDLVRFTPPRFGRQSLHTTGNLNVGGAIRMKGVIKHIHFTMAIGKGQNAPTVRYDEDPYVSYTFEINDDSHMTQEVPEDMDFTQEVVIKIHWYTTDATADGVDEVRWEAQWATRAPGENITTGDTTDNSGDIDCVAANILVETTIETIPANSIAPSDQLGIHIKRIALSAGTDPTAGTIHVVDVELEYTSNKLGRSV